MRRWSRTTPCSISASSMPSSSAPSRPRSARDRLVDTLMLARRKHPGGSNRLDDLCARYRIDNSQAHQARRAARRRAAGRGLCRADRRAPGDARPGRSRQRRRRCGAQRRWRRSASVRSRCAPRITDEERAAHRAFIATLGESAIWRKYLTVGCRRRRLALDRRLRRLRLHLRHLLLVERDEIDRIEHQRREAAVAHRVAMISRANGNSSRGHSIIITGWMLLLRHVLDAGTRRHRPARS